MQKISINTKKTIQTVIIAYFFIFILLCLNTYFVLNFIEKDNKEKYLKQTTITYTKAYNAIYEQYKELSEVLFSEFINFNKIDEKLYNLEKKTYREKSVIRRTIYLQTLKRFNELKSKHLIDINYILPDNTVFLEMEDPLKFENKISKKRLIIKKVQETKIKNDSYEIGKNGSGFRFVFPIIKEGKYLGIFCITFDEKAITSSIIKQYNVLSNIIISDKEFNKDILKNSKKYQQSDFDGFLHNKKVLKDIKKTINKDIINIKPNNKISKSLFLEKIDMIVTTIPITHKISGEKEAFISILSEAYLINTLNNSYFIIFALFVFLYLTIFLLFLQQKIKILIDQQRVKEMIKKDQQLLEQAKMAQMGEMIGNIAHQWRQPLSAITTIASGLKLNYEYKLLKNADIPKQMDLIVNNANYLSKTIDTFRDYIKEEKIKKDILIQKVIDESLKIVNASIKSHYINIIKDIDYKHPIIIKMVPDEFSQAIINILNNAKDAIVQNDIKNGWIKISQKIQNNDLVISIEDNAKGIKEETISKIFDPYFTTKHKYQGTGLGLYMTKTIIEKHLHGKIDVSNTKNGALFTIKLKIKQKKNTKQFL